MSTLALLSKSGGSIEIGWWVFMNRGQGRLSTCWHLLHNTKNNRVLYWERKNGTFMLFAKNFGWFSTFFSREPRSRFLLKTFSQKHRLQETESKIKTEPIVMIEVEDEFTRPRRSNMWGFPSQGTETDKPGQWKFQVALLCWTNKEKRQRETWGSLVAVSKSSSLQTSHTSSFDVEVIEVNLQKIPGHCE